MYDEVQKLLWYVLEEVPRACEEAEMEAAPPW